MKTFYIILCIALPILTGIIITMECEWGRRGKSEKYGEVFHLYWKSIKQFLRTFLKNLKSCDICHGIIAFIFILLTEIAIVYMSWSNGYSIGIIEQPIPIVTSLLAISLGFILLYLPIYDGDTRLRYLGVYIGAAVMMITSIYVIFYILMGEDGNGITNVAMAYVANNTLIS